MTIDLRLKLYKILLYTARIAYENTYDMREEIAEARFQNYCHFMPLSVDATLMHDGSINECVLILNWGQVIVKYSTYDSSSKLNANPQQNTTHYPETSSKRSVSDVLGASISVATLKNRA